MYPDSGWGFLVLKSMEKGAPFNYSKIPDSKDISRDQLQFCSWWTPGQYALPGAIKHSFNLKLGPAIIVTVILFNALGLLGYYNLYRFFGFNSLLSAAAILIIVLQGYFSEPFVYYNGGELLLFGSVPWITLYFLKNQRMSMFSMAIIILMSLAGFFLKGSFVTSFLAILLTLTFLEIHRLNAVQAKGGLLLKNSLIYILKMSVVALVVYFFVHAIFFSKGPNPASITKLNFNLGNAVFSISASILSSFSIDDVLNWPFRFSGHNYLLFNFSIFYLFSTAFSCFVFIAIIMKKALKDTYKIALTVFFVVFFLFLTISYFKGSEISYEWRHFRPAGMLFLPGILYIFYGDKDFKAYRFIFSMFLIGMCFFGLFEFFATKIYLKGIQSVSKDAFCQRNIDKGALAVLHRLDGSLTSGNNLFYVTSPEIALDIKNNRWMASLADFESVDTLKSRSYFGKTDNLFLFLPGKYMINGKEKAIISSFKDYKNFKVVYETSGSRILEGF